jgi:hypothetical protein
MPQPPRRCPRYEPALGTVGLEAWALDAQAVASPLNTHDASLTSTG